MATIAKQITDLIAAAAQAAGYGDSPVPLEPALPCNDSRHGDYQSNYAFRLGKALRTNPRAVAEAVMAALPPNDIVESANVAGPGFINFRLHNAFLGDDVRDRPSAPSFGADLVVAGRTMVIDFSSPNIAKRMHVGHLRSTIIGDAINRLYRYLGWTVVSDNHIGDWGTPFGKLIVAWARWRDDDAYADDNVGELQRLYQLFGERSRDDDGALIELARAETAKLQAGDQENRALWAEFCRVSLIEFNGVYDRLGVHFDVTLGESFYRDGLDELVDGMLESGLAIVDKGAVIVPFTGDDGKGLKKNPLLIRKADGASLYGTTDLATVKHRVDNWSPDRVIYETDVRQQLHFRQVFAAGRKLGYDLDYHHVGHGMLRFAGGDIASTRAGGALNLVDVLDTAVDHARTVVDSLSGHLPEQERAAIAEAVGVGAVKYTDLSQNPSSDIIFDWDRMLAIEGNTAPYIMYANARCHSIFRKSDLGLLADWAPRTVVLTHATERALALAIARTPEIAMVAAESNRPNLLAEHVFGLAKAMARFHKECRVLSGDNDEQTTFSRLTLVWSTSRALELCMELLGLTPLARM
ncbi:MAG: arginyl-tRNA synthetase [Kiritimatiellia bacterium]|jgi:arginyl-tRNA synthetase